MNSDHFDIQSLYAEDRGEGPPVVFVHGDLSDYRVWNRQLEYFSQSFRTITYSRRYHYPNAPIPDGLDNRMDVHVEDLEQLLECRAAAPAHIAGDSWGAFVSLRLAIRRPELVRSLVLAEPPVIPLLGLDTPPRPLQLIRLLISHPLTAVAFLRFAAQGLVPAVALFRAGDLDAGMRRFARAVLGRDVFGRLSEERLAQVNQNIKPLAASLLGAGFPPIRASEIAQMTVPTLVVFGDRTPTLFKHLSRRLIGLLPNAEAFVVEAASHSAHEQNPDAYNARVRAFFEKHSD